MAKSAARRKSRCGETGGEAYRSGTDVGSRRAPPRDRRATNVASTLHAVSANTTNIYSGNSMYVEMRPRWAHFLFMYSHRPLVGLAEVHQEKMRSLHASKSLGGDCAKRGTIHEDERACGI